ncbi:MAG: 50S ribosomal protein L9 [Deltaproteobacteria bacterium]|nr:50S ribosomal protein L9 [Deltaproteobacteria bacterium]
MKVIFIEDVEGTAYAGDIKEVANGFARNYLVPRKLAFPATKKSIKSFQEKEKSILKKAEKKIRDTQNLKEQIEKVSLDFKRKVGKEGKLFGAVTSQEISEALLDKGIDIGRKTIRLKQDMKKIGEYLVEVALYRGIKANLKIVIEAEEEKEKQE